MPRGVAHSPELRAEVVAAVLAGAKIADVARRNGLDRGLVSRWVAAAMQPSASAQRARDEDPSDQLARRILALIGRHIETLDAQLSTAARATWVEKQSAAELAELVATERDTLIRLLAGLPRPEPPDEPAGALEPAPPSTDTDG